MQYCAHCTACAEGFVLYIVFHLQGKADQVAKESFIRFCTGTLGA